MRSFYSGLDFFPKTENTSNALIHNRNLVAKKKSTTKQKNDKDLVSSFYKFTVFFIGTEQK